MIKPKPPRLSEVISSESDALREAVAQFGMKLDELGNDENIFEALRESWEKKKPKTVGDLAEEFGVTTDYIGNAIKRWKMRGRVLMVRQGLWVPERDA